MRWRLRLGLVLVACLSIGAWQVPLALADAPICTVVDRYTGTCSVSVGAPADPGGNGGDTENASANQPNDTGPGSPCVIQVPEPHVVPCETEDGYYTNDGSCYLKMLDPQPPASDPSWPQLKNGGAIWQCTSPNPGVVVVQFWAPSPPPGAAAGPTPAEVTQMAVDKMDLHAVAIGIVPKPGADSIGLVGMPVWMWVADAGPSTTGPTSATASAGGITITATATLSDITWDMGDGKTVVCHGGGTPYDRSKGTTASPDCGYTYSTSSFGQPQDKFTVSATSHWTVSWTGAGQSGQLSVDELTQSVQIAVGEAQVLVTQ